MLLGILEGVSEWLPVSSTGHMILADRFLRLDVSESFKNIYLYLIQLGAVCAVPTLFWRKLSPFRLPGEEGGVWHRGRLRLWRRVILACLPGAAATLILNLFPAAEKALERPATVAGALIFYGIAFLLIERAKKGASFPVETLSDLSDRHALWIGLFQVLALVPGTSRSGATVLGALLLGISRPAAAEFTFALALPVMTGMSAVKIFENGLSFSASEWALLAAGALAAYLTSLLVMRGLTAFLRRRSFALFGWYRIALGLAVILFSS